MIRFNPEKQKEYFSNFPFDEKAVRIFLKCLQMNRWFELYNVETEPLINMLTYPDSKQGFRILNVTTGFGVHNTMMHTGHPLLDTEYKVEENEIYITYNTTEVLSGGKFTCVISLQDGVYIIKNHYTHSRS